MGLTGLPAATRHMIFEKSLISNPKKHMPLKKKAARVIVIDMNAEMRSGWTENSTMSSLIGRMRMKLKNYFMKNDPTKPKCVVLLFDDYKKQPELRRDVQIRRSKGSTDSNLKTKAENGEIPPLGIQVTDEQRLGYKYWVTEQGKVVKQSERPYELPHERAEIEKLSFETDVDWNRIYGTSHSKNKIFELMYQYCSTLAATYCDPKVGDTCIFWRSEPEATYWPNIPVESLDSITRKNPHWTAGMSNRGSRRACF